jgi:hypothetical protein
VVASDEFVMITDSVIGSNFETAQQAPARPTAPTPSQTLGSQYKSRKSDRERNGMREMCEEIPTHQITTHQNKPKSVRNQTKGKIVKYSTNDLHGIEIERRK